MINLEEYKKKKYEEYRKEVDTVIKNFAENKQRIESALNGDEFRLGLGLDPVIDHLAVLQQISMDGTSIRNEIEKLNKKYGYSGEKVFEMRLPQSHWL